jgi:hypothetical protein
MKRHIRVSKCPVCGHRANTSKWWTKAPNGKKYYYFRFYHSFKNIHLVRTDSTYSTPSGVGKRQVDLYGEFQYFVYRRMGARKYSYTAFKEEFERFVGHNVHSQSFCRIISKAVSSKLIKKKRKDKRAVYEKESDPKLDEEMKFEKFAIHYDFSRPSGTIRISTFLEVINTGRLTVDKIPFYIPYGIVNSVDELHLKLSSEEGIVPKRNFKILISDASETIVSISLLRGLKFNEQEFVSAIYEIPKENNTIRLVAKANIGLLRLGVSLNDSSKVETVRTLVDGAKEEVYAFQHKCDHTDRNICHYSEFEGILKGECVSVRFMKG